MKGKFGLSTGIARDPKSQGKRKNRITVWNGTLRTQSHPTA